MLLLNSGRQSVADCFQRACGPAANVYQTLAQHPLVISLMGASNGTGRTMSGAFGVAAALLLCRKKVDLYGFSQSYHANGPPPYYLGSQSNHANGLPPYHYYVRTTATPIRASLIRTLVLRASPTATWSA